MRTKNDKQVRFLPSSIVPRKPPPGIQRGGAPWSSWKEARGNRLEIGSLWRVFAYFLHVEKVGRRRRRDRKTNRRGERRMRRGPMDCPLRRGRGQDGSVSPAGDPISFSGKEMGERNRQREPIPKAVPFGNPPHRPGGCGPLEIPQRFTGDDGRGTGVWTGVTD